MWKCVNVIISSRFATKKMAVILACLVLVFQVLQISGCGVEIVNREGWGARPPKELEYMEMPVPHIFIHHTAMGSCSNFTSCARMMRAIQNFHMDDNGWDDIGYNFLIGGDGRVYEGRGWTRVGAHTFGYNRKAVAFCLMGNYVSEPPSIIMLDTAKKMIRCAQNLAFVSKDYKIHGHRDAGCTECPGQALYDIIKKWNRFEAGPLPDYSCRTG